MKVKYIGCTDDQARCGSGDDPRQFLVKGLTYDLVAEEVHSWHTIYRLDGIDAGFNSVCFEEVIPQCDPENLDVTGDLTMEAIEEAALKSAMNMGPAQDIWHPDYGWIMQNGEITDAGIEFFEKEYERP